MNIDKNLDWEESASDGGTVFEASGYFVYQYRLGAANQTWRLEGHGLDILNRDPDNLKQRAQENYTTRRRLVAWREYMLTHEPGGGVVEP